MSFSLVALVVLLLIFVFFWRTRNHRLLSYDFPEAWRETLKQTYPLIELLSPLQKNKFEKQVQAFMGNLSFHPIADFSPTHVHKLQLVGGLGLLSLKKQTLPKKLKRVLILGPGDSFEIKPMEEIHELVVRFSTDDFKLVKANGDQSFFSEVVRKYESSLILKDSLDEIIYQPAGEVKKYKEIVLEFGWQ